MIQAVSSINNNQNYVNFEGRRGGLFTKKVMRRTAKKAREAADDVLCTLGIKKKQTLADRISNFFSRKTKAVKKNGKNVLVEEEPKKKGLLATLTEDFLDRVEKAKEVLDQ